MEEKAVLEEEAVDIFKYNREEFYKNMRKERHRKKEVVFEE